MNFIKKSFGLFVLLLCFGCETTVKAPLTTTLPHLKKKGNTTQLIVEDAPFLILGGELGNSTFTSLAAMESVWPTLKKLHLNTLLVPVYWELIEPVEGQFDFSLYKQLIAEAQKHELKLVLLWFGSWKNSMSSHAPAWVKKDQARFPRVKDEQGISQEILSPFSKNNLQADLHAYEALMGFVRSVNEKQQSILMVQTENEIGMLPSARDHHPLANAQFEAAVPQELISYLNVHKGKLVPEFEALWAAQGYKSAGNWEVVFGKGSATEELFMAWYFAKFTEAVIAAGKAVYPLPMFVNAALNAPQKKPGEYPSAGPLPHLMDVWKAAGPSIDFLSPDFYNPDFKHWCDLYVRQNNPLFVPEHRFDTTAAAKAIYTIGHYEGMGFSPFSIENPSEDHGEKLGKVYALLEQLTPTITQLHGAQKMDAVLLDNETTEVQLRFGNYEFTVKHSYTLPWEVKTDGEIWPPSAALILQTDADTFFFAGTGIVITFKSLVDPSLRVGILKNEEGSFENGKWVVHRHLNGDQTHQGRHVRLFQGDYAIQKLSLYTYE